MSPCATGTMVQLLPPLVITIQTQSDNFHKSMCNRTMVRLLPSLVSQSKHNQIFSMSPHATEQWFGHTIASFVIGSFTSLQAETSAGC